MAILVIALVQGGSMRGQEPPRQDVLGTLLVEVRALRGAIEQMTSASARVQLAVGRLQIQEQRVNALSRQLSELRQALGAAEQEAVLHEGQVADLEQVLPDTSDPTERQAIAGQITALKKILSSGVAGLQKMRSEEAELAGIVATEQGRWTEINGQLDAIDQTLRR
jgi:chromosome segregation ATPase